MKRILAPLLFFVILAILFRLPNLTQRPLHVDEAVNAYILGTLIETGTYEYNPGEYHGPSLYYISSIFTYLYGSSDFSELDEFIIRIIPIFAGLLIVILTFFIGNLIKPIVGMVAAIVVSVSPMMIYFNRYYIHESWLVVFSLAVMLAGISYIRNPGIKPAIWVGLWAGLLIATKETWLIYIFSLIMSLFIIRLYSRDFVLPEKKYIAVALLTAGTVVLLLFSSFFTNWQGLISFANSFQNYFVRGTATPEHTHSWYYYINILFFYHADGRWFFSELPVLVLGIPGIIVCFKNRLGKKGLLLGSFFILYLILFSLIPYKTPWNMLGLVPIMALLAGIGVWYIWEIIKISKYKLAFIVPLLLLLILLVHESWQLNYLYSDAPENPYTYGHARQEIKEISEKLDELQNKYHDLLKTRIDVIAKNAEYWPLPWYLRRYNKVAWWNSVPKDIASTPIVILTPEIETDFIHQIYEKTPFNKRKLYLPLFENDIELRPGVMIRGYIHKELWENIYNNN
jgi:uncharacterized protein (TIGR03663 family)